MQKDPDRDLVLRCQVVGSQEFEDAFRLIYEKYRDKVYRLAFRIIGDPSDALDATQEAFVLLYQNLESFRFESKFSSWLYRLAVNSSIDHLRRIRRTGGEIHLEDGEDLGLEDQTLPGPRKALEEKDHVEQIRAGIGKLSDKLRIITVLRYQQNLSYGELAEILEISIGTVKSRLARAHLALSSHLGHLLEGSRPGDLSGKGRSPADSLGGTGA